MSEKPIIFNAEMVRAILKGTKTQTRRVIKPPLFLPGGLGRYLNRVYFAFYNVDREVTYYRTPPYLAGDLLWVRESIRRKELSQGYTGATYLADSTAVLGRGSKGSYCGRALTDWKWKRDTLPSIHMPRWASRITLEIIEVRAEQIQQISYEDIRAEGIEKELTDTSKQMKNNFIKLWDSINAKRGFAWEDNPWVWVMSFKYAQSATGRYGEEHLRLWQQMVHKRRESSGLDHFRRQ